MDASLSPQSERPLNYSRIALSLHWISMFLIIALWIAGFVMVRFMEDSATRSLIYRAHIFGGNLITLLTLVRVGLVFFEKRPAPPEGVTGFKRVLFEGNHYALYVILLLLGFSGSAMIILSGISPNSIPNLTPDMIQDIAPRQGHRLFSIVFMLLLVAHTVGVLRYQFMEGDVMKRMGVNFPGKK